MKLLLKSAEYYFNIKKYAKLIRESDLYDQQWYTSNYPEWKASGLSPAEHYLTVGHDQGYNPSRRFNTRAYLGANPDVGRYGMNALVHYLLFGKKEGRPIPEHGGVQVHVYNSENLGVSVNSIYNLPEVVVDKKRRKTVNILVPAFDFGSISAGFFGVFKVALFIKQCGFHTRIVLFDRFDFDLKKAQKLVKSYPGMERLFTDLEVEYIGDRKKPLLVSPKDNSVATVWYSAYMAQKIQKVTGQQKRPFLYLIQDYESVFYPSSTHYALADATYSFNYCGLFSTKALMDFFIGRRLIKASGRSKKYIYFNNACSANLPPKTKFLKPSTENEPRKLAFYSRPMVHRNMFELGALAICEAHRQGIFKGNWQFFGMGLGNSRIAIGSGVDLIQLPRMNLKEYLKVVGTFDLGLSLMASPHPSLVPFDLLGSGVVTVTNSFYNKDQAYFDQVAKGMIVAEPTLESVVEGLRTGVERVADKKTRYADAENMRFPRSWDQTFSREHKDFVRTLFGS